MSDSWLQRLVVRGPEADVSAFSAAVRSDARLEYRTVERQFKRQKLSFVRLRDSLPPGLRRTTPVPDEEPWDLVVEPPRRFRDGTVELTYKFQLSAYEPEVLILAASTVYPLLCFVVACVSPSDDQQYSLLIHRGEKVAWRLPARRKAAILKKVPKETEDNGDQVDLALAEADWEMMDEVVSQWRTRAARLMTDRSRNVIDPRETARREPRAVRRARAQTRRGLS
jgi:hypothetical protein